MEPEQFSVVLGTKKSDIEMQTLGAESKEEPTGHHKGRRKGAVTVCASGHQAPLKPEEQTENKSGL